MTFDHSLNLILVSKPENASKLSKNVCLINFFDPIDLNNHSFQKKAVTLVPKLIFLNTDWLEFDPMILWIDFLPFNEI